MEELLLKERILCYTILTNLNNFGGVFKISRSG